ncbi:hypothetical protein [Stieleria sp.]|uniref:hypothetical protein n=1 Tax=Stieleria sp. TaxID=2795976 RepID=UPI00356345DB
MPDRPHGGQDRHRPRQGDQRSSGCDSSGEDAVGPYRRRAEHYGDVADAPDDTGE